MMTLPDVEEVGDEEEVDEDGDMDDEDVEVGDDDVEVDSGQLGDEMGTHMDENVASCDKLVKGILFFYGFA